MSGPHALNLTLENLANGRDPAWDAALRQAATWHAPYWDDTALIPQQNAALLLTALLIYVLAAQRAHDAAGIEPSDVVTALDNDPLDTWLATSLAECGHHAEDGTDSLATSLTMLRYHHPADPGIESLGDGTGWSGSFLRPAACCTRFLLTRYQESGSR